jgi:hypothetical protein
VRCHAMVVPADGPFCARANNVARLSEICFELLTRPTTPLTPWPRIISACRPWFWQSPTTPPPPPPPGSPLFLPCSHPPHSRRRVDCCITCHLSPSRLRLPPPPPPPAHFRLPASPEHKGCLLGTGCTVAERVVLKATLAGNGCTVGEGSQLNNCVLMRDVVIGPGCKLQNWWVGAPLSPPPPPSPAPDPARSTWAFLVLGPGLPIAAFL